MKKEIMKAMWLGVLVVMAGCASGEVLAPTTGASADVPAPEPGTQAYYELKIKGRYALDGGALVPIVPAQTKTTSSSRLPSRLVRPTASGTSSWTYARWLEGPIMQVISNNLAVVGKAVTNLSGAVTVSRMGVVALSDTRQVTLGEIRRMLAVPAERYSYVTASGESGTLSGYREALEPTYDEYLEIYNRDLQSAPELLVDPKAQPSATTASEPPAATTTTTSTTPAKTNDAIHTEGNYTFSTNAVGEATILGFDRSYSGSLAITNTLGGCRVTSIGDKAFIDHYGLTSVAIPVGVTNIGKGAFYRCYGLASIVIPAGVISIGNEAFFSDPDLKSVTIPNSVANIGDGAFSGCSGLTAILVHDANTAYSNQDGVLFNKDRTTLLRYPEGRKGIYTVPVGVARIGDRAFSGCTGLTSVAIPPGVTNIGDLAFCNCTGLTSVAIPASVTSIASSAFFGCSVLSSIDLDESSVHYSSADGVLFNKDKTHLALCSKIKTGHYTIPSSVASIGDSAFSGCTGLTGITISNSVTRIGYAAFRGCTGLTSVAIPSSVTSVASFAFDDCTRLASIHVDESNVHFSSADGVLFNKDKTHLLLCLKGKTGHYTIPSSVTSISGFSFENCTSLTGVTIPAGVVSIEHGTFERCTNLTSVAIPDSVAKISNFAFTDCTGLTNVFFEGDAPSGGSDGSIFSGTHNATVYYRPGTKGWGATFGGRPTKVWEP